MASLGLGWVGEPIFTAMLSPLLLSLHVQSEAARHSISFAILQKSVTPPVWVALKYPLVPLTV